MTGLAELVHARRERELGRIFLRAFNAIVADEQRHTGVDAPTAVRKGFAQNVRVMRADEFRPSYRPVLRDDGSWEQFAAAQRPDAVVFLGRMIELGDLYRGVGWANLDSKTRATIGSVVLHNLKLNFSMIGRGQRVVLIRSHWFNSQTPAFQREVIAMYARNYGRVLLWDKDEILRGVKK